MGVPVPHNKTKIKIWKSSLEYQTRIYILVNVALRELQIFPTDFTNFSITGLFGRHFRTCAGA